MAKKKTDTQSYEVAMQELQQIVADLQAEAIGIDDLSEKVKRAAELIQLCKTKLRNTETDLENFIT